MKKILEYTDGDCKQTFVLSNDVFSILSKSKVSKNSDDLHFTDKVFGKDRGSEFGIKIMKGFVNMFLDKQLEDYKEEINNRRLKKEGKGGLNIKCSCCKKKLKNYNDYFWCSFDEDLNGKRSFGIHLIDMTTHKFPKKDILICINCWQDDKYYKRANNANKRSNRWKFKNKKVRIPKKVENPKKYLLEKLKIN
jgi:hypothetical protein